VPFAPGHVRKYEIRVLYEHFTATPLAFAKPGLYWVKVRYPLTHERPGPPKSSETRRFDSNTILLRINEPQGFDANVWQTLRAPEFLYFMQSGLLPREHPEVPRKSAELLRKYPKNIYEPALRYALKKYYRHERWYGLKDRVFDDPVMEQIRTILGLPREPDGPYQADEILDQVVSFDFGDNMRVDEALKKLSDLTGVPLRVEPHYADRTISGKRENQTLRTIMAEFEHLQGKRAFWNRERGLDYRYRLGKLTNP
jgi:hypothetical protein